MFENDLAINLREKWDLNSFMSINIFQLVQEKINNLTLLWMPIDNDIWVVVLKIKKIQLFY